MQAAVDELKRQEQALKDQLASLDAIANDDQQGLVKRNKAKQEKEQLLSHDPLPLRKAQITQSAALRRLEQARKTQEEQTKKVEAATRETEAKFAEALAFLEEMKKKAGAPQGALWWLQREVTEQRKYMPKSRQ